MADQAVFAILDDEFRIVKTNAPRLTAQQTRGGCVVLNLEGVFRPGQNLFAVATVTHFTFQEQNLKDNVHIYAYLENKIEVRTGDSNGSLASRGFTIAIYGSDRL